MQIVQECGNIRIICHTVDFPDRPLPFHWHTNYELCQALEPCRFLIDGDQVEAAAGDLITIHEQTVHRFLIPTGGARIRILQFPLGTLHSCRTPLVPLRRHIPLDEIRRIDRLEDHVRTLLDMMETERPLYAEGENPALQSMTCALYFLLARHFPDQTTKTALRKSRSDFELILRYVHAHFGEPITLLSLSNALHMPRARISSVFSGYAGFSLSEYLNMLRVQKANELISQGMSVTYAALESGFQSIRTFNDVYRRLTGHAPTDHLR